MSYQNFESYLNSVKHAENKDFNNIKQKEKEEIKSLVCFIN